MSDDLAQFIDDVARELGCEPDNEVILARIAAMREAIRKIRATDNITAVWHIADAALAPSPAGSMEDGTK